MPPEAIGTISYCGKNSYILTNDNELNTLKEKIKKSSLNKIAIISQTTFSHDKFNYLVNLLKETFKNFDINIYNTICPSTRLRQSEAKEISKIVDKMLIIGDENSSNTKKLYEISKENCISYLIKTPKQLDSIKLKPNDKIGIISGASASIENVNEIIKYIRKKI